MRRNRFWMAFSLLFFAGGWLPAMFGPPAWAVDPLVKVFRDTEAPKGTSPVVSLHACRNEYVSGQIAVRSPVAVAALTARWDGLRHRTSDYAVPDDALRVRFVGFVPVKENTPQTPDDLLLFAAPGDCPDPLLDAESVKLEVDRTQPVWLTVFVPADAPAGDYEGRVVLSAGEASIPASVSLHVDPFVLPEERTLWVTNWFSAGRIAGYHNVEPWSEAHWTLLDRYARNMAEHRQNVVLTPLSLVEIAREENGRLTFDYARFDRWVRLFEKAGAIGRIELGHTAHHGEGGWSSDEFILNDVNALDRETGKTVSLPPDEGLAPLLRDLQRHLEERGWLGRTMIHIGDEPALHNIDSWIRASAFVHACAPRIPRIEAIESRDYYGVLEMWVPKLNYIPTWGEDYREAQAAGNEIWFYTCLHPRGRYPNRLLDMPLAATRVLHWINWSHRLDGYLHWGWNSWRDDPFENLGPDRLPPGDCYIVYPGKDGPLDSIRWETMRDGIEDFEKLRLLAERTRAAIERLGDAAAGIDPEERADEICRRIVPAITDFERDPEAFRETLDLLHEEILAIDSPPLAVVATAPEAETVVVSGPIVIEAFGAVEPGAKVEMHGRAVELEPDGRFSVRTSPDRSGNIELTIEKDGRKKTIRRHFQVR